MRFLFAALALAAILAVPADAQAPRVKTGYEVKGPTCYFRTHPNGRVHPIPCDAFKRVFIRARDDGANG